MEVIAQGLSDLGLLGAVPPQLVVSSAVYRAFYPHAVGHWLGMDTHDVPSVSADSPFLPGTVLTVEPGVYLPARPQFGPYAGIGVRIEDDVLVTEVRRGRRGGCGGDRGE